MRTIRFWKCKDCGGISKKSKSKAFSIYLTCQHCGEKQYLSNVILIKKVLILGEYYPYYDYQEAWEEFGVLIEVYRRRLSKMGILGD